MRVIYLFIYPVSVLIHIRIQYVCVVNKLKLFQFSGGLVVMC